MNNKEILLLKKKSDLIINFFKNLPGFNLATFEELEKLIEGNFDLHNVKGLKLILKDLEAWASGLPPDQKVELDKILTINLFSKLDVARSNRVKKILRKGIISTEEDFELIYHFSQDLAENDELFSSLPILQKLMSEYKE